MKKTCCDICDVQMEKFYRRMKVSTWFYGSDTEDLLPEEHKRMKELRDKLDFSSESDHKIFDAEWDEVNAKTKLVRGNSEKYDERKGTVDVCLDCFAKIMPKALWDKLHN